MPACLRRQVLGLLPGGIARRPRRSHGGSNDALTVTDGLEDLALDAARDLEDASAEEIVRWATDTFGDRFAVTASMSDGVLSHVAGRAAPGVTVLFLDTGYHFPETIGTRDASPPPTPSRSRPSPTRCVSPSTRRSTAVCTRSIPTCAARFARSGRWTGRCVRTTPGPSGVRRAELASRADTPVVGWDAKRRKVKVNPLATWTDEQVAAYVAEHGILVNPLRQIGYTSIGCAPCTRPVAGGRRPPIGPVGRAGEVRVRDPLMSKPPSVPAGARRRRAARGRGRRRPGRGTAGAVAGRGGRRPRGRLAVLSARRWPT